MNVQKNTQYTEKVLIISKIINKFEIFMMKT